MFFNSKTIVLLKLCLKSHRVQKNVQKMIKDDDKLLPNMTADHFSVERRPYISPASLDTWTLHNGF